MREDVLVALFITSVLAFIIALYVVVSSILPNKKRTVRKEKARLNKNE